MREAAPPRRRPAPPDRARPGLVAPMRGHTRPHRL